MEWLMAARWTLPDHSLHHRAHRTHLVKAQEMVALRRQALRDHGQDQLPFPDPKRK